MFIFSWISCLPFRDCHSCGDDIIQERVVGIMGRWLSRCCCLFFDEEGGESSIMVEVVPHCRLNIHSQANTTNFVVFCLWSGTHAA